MTQPSTALFLQPSMMSAEETRPLLQRRPQRRRYFLFIVLCWPVLYVATRSRPATLLVEQPPQITKVYYINCETSAYRRAFMESWLASFGVPYERFECVGGNSLQEIQANMRPSRMLRNLTDERLMNFGNSLDAVMLAHTVGCYASHYLLLEEIARQPDGLYLLLEDDVSPLASRSDVEAAAATLPDDFAYAGLNVHDYVCAEDIVGDWALRRQVPRRQVPPDCTPHQLSAAWGPLFFDLSDAASLVTPSNVPRVLDWLDAQPFITENDRALMSPDAAVFASYVPAKRNLFATDIIALPETRAAHDTTRRE